MKRARPRTGFTIVELMASLGTAALLSAAMTSAIYVTVKGTSMAESTLGRAEASVSVTQMLGEIREAKTIISHSATGISFTIADRTGDSADETISYSWSGSTNAPLVRTQNGASRNIIGEVQSFALNHTTDAASVVNGTTTVSNVTVHSQTSATSASTVNVTATQQVGQFCDSNALPTTAQLWRPTLIRFSARKSTTGQTGTVIVEARAASPGGWPIGTLIGQQTYEVTSWSTSSFAWRDFNISSSPWLGRTQGISFYIRRGTTTDDVVISHVAPSAASDALRSTDSGQAWTLYTNVEARHQLFGEYTTPAAATNQTYLRWVNAVVTLPAPANSPIAGSTETLNRPELP